MKPNGPHPERELFKHHGLRWCLDELRDTETSRRRSDEATFRSIVALDAALKRAVDLAPEPRERQLLARRDILEVRSEVLGWWGNAIAGFGTLTAAGFAVIVPQFTAAAAHAWGFIGFVLAFCSLMVKAQLDKRRIVAQRELLSAKREIARQQLQG